MATVRQIERFWIQVGLTAWMVAHGRETWADREAAWERWRVAHRSVRRRWVVPAWARAVSQWGRMWTRRHPVVVYEGGLWEVDWFGDGVGYGGARWR